MRAAALTRNGPERVDQRSGRAAPPACCYREQSVCSRKRIQSAHQCVEQGARWLDQTGLRGGRQPPDQHRQIEAEFRFIAPIRRHWRHRDAGWYRSAAAVMMFTPGQRRARVDGAALVVGQLTAGQPVQVITGNFAVHIVGVPGAVQRAGHAAALDAAAQLGGSGEQPLAQLGCDDWRTGAKVVGGGFGHAQTHRVAVNGVAFPALRAG